MEAEGRTSFKKEWYCVILRRVPSVAGRGRNQAAEDLWSKKLVEKEKQSGAFYLWSQEQKAVQRPGQLKNRFLSLSLSIYLYMNINSIFLPD